MFLAIFTLTRGQNSKKSCQTFSVDIRTLKTGYFTVTELNGNNFRFSSMQICFFLFWYSQILLMIVPLCLKWNPRSCVSSYRSYALRMSHFVFRLKQKWSFCFFVYKQYGREKKNPTRPRCWTTAICVVQVTIFLLKVHPVPLNMTTKQAVSNFFIHALACAIGMYRAGVRFGQHDQNVIAA